MDADDLLFFTGSINSCGLQKHWSPQELVDNIYNIANFQKHSSPVRMKVLVLCSRHTWGFTLVCQKILLSSKLNSNSYIFFGDGFQ